MMNSRSLKVVGTGHCLPDRIVKSSELASKLDLRPGWIEEKQGVRQRHWVQEEQASMLAAHAGKVALDAAGVSPESIDLILNASGTVEQSIPDGASLIQREMGLGRSGIAAFSVHSTCLSFLAAFDLAASLLDSQRYERILLVSSDITSRGIDLDEPESATLMGDGAAAVVVTRAPAEESSVVHAAHFETFGHYAALTECRGGGTRYHPNDPCTVPKDNLFHMDGPAVYRQAVGRARRFFQNLQSRYPCEPEQIDLVISHQASKRGLEALSHLGFSLEKVHVTLERYGNCVAASIPLTLHDAISSGRLLRGQKVLLFGTGAGLSLGGVLFTY